MAQTHINVFGRLRGEYSAVADLGVHRASAARETWRWTPLDSKIGLPLIRTFTANFGIIGRQSVCGTGVCVELKVSSGSQ